MYFRIHKYMNRNKNLVWLMPTADRSQPGSFILNLCLGSVELTIDLGQPFYMTVACRFFHRNCPFEGPWTHTGGVCTAVLTTLLPDGGDWLASCQLGSSRTGLDTLEKRKISYPCSEWNYSSSHAAHSLVSIVIMLSQLLPYDQHTCNYECLLSIPGHFVFMNICIRNKG